jgi:hypothetical protein
MASLQGYVDSQFLSLSQSIIHLTSDLIPSRTRPSHSTGWASDCGTYLIICPRRLGRSVWFAGTRADSAVGIFFFQLKQGVLAGYDQKSNVVLSDSKERVYSMDEGVEEIPLGLYLVKGDMMYVKHIQFPLLTIGSCYSYAFFFFVGFPLAESLLESLTKRLKRIQICRLFALNRFSLFTGHSPPRNPPP